MPEQPNPALRIEQVPLDQLRAISASGELYAIADACDAPAVPKKVLELGPGRAVSLYRGTAEEEFWEVAPYLIHVDPPVLDWILSTLDLTRWGIFAVSKANFDALRRQFRRFLRALTPTGDIWLFRFYDPRVLQPFLPACTLAEIAALFGPVLALAIASPDFRSVSVSLFRPNGAPSNDDRLSSSPLFRLRNAHIDALRPQAERAFAFEIMTFLRKAVPRVTAGISVEALEQRVMIGLARARRYQFTRNSSLAAFVTLMLDIAPDFDEQPAIAAVLSDARFTPDLRMDMLIGRTAESDWEEAASKARLSVWQEMKS